MKAKVLIIIIIATAVTSSVTTYMIIPVQNTASFYPNWLQDNIDATTKLRDSSIPIMGVDVDEKIGILTIYMTDENSKKYTQEIDNLLDVPFEILSETQSKEIECLKTYKSIREIPKTHNVETSELHIIKHLKHSVGQYVELKCPDFSDLESIKKNLKRYSLVVIPQNAYVEGGQKLSPKEITVVLGINNTVTWINEDDVSHGIIGDDGKNNWSSRGIYKPGESFSVTFNSTGTFEYSGESYPWMTGTVIVLGR